jgi:two-component system, OmpR family, heavy metal sensor histidine kinase CusS
MAGAIRLAAGVGLLGVVGSWSAIKHIHFELVLVAMVAYVCLAAGAVAAWRRRLGRGLAWVMPFLDLALAYFAHQIGITTFKPFTASWALSCLGVFTLIVALVGLTMPVRLLATVTALAVAAQWAALREPGITLYALLVASFTIVFTAVATAAIPRVVESARGRAQQAAVTLDSLARAREQNRRLELLQREKDNLLETMVHDMRSPVGAAMLSLEYLGLELKKLPGHEPMLEATTDAVTTLNSLSNLITQILDTSKLESGRITLRLDRVEVRPLLETIHRELGTRAAGRGITSNLEPMDGLYAAIDMRLFPRALDVLGTHLLRHTPEGGRMLVVATGSADEVRLSLHSTAPALAPAERERIFDKFPQTDGLSKRAAGWALGLYFCRLVVSAHQGTIALEDVDGWSTSFVIRLPRQAPPP